MSNANPPREIAFKKELDALKIERTSLLSRIETLEKEGSELRLQLKELDALKTERASLLSRIGTLEKEGSELRLQLEANKATIEQLINEKQELTKRVDDLRKAMFEVKVEDIASVFKNALQSLQREMKKIEKPGEMGYFIDKFEVEMKSGLDLKEGVKLVQPTAAELKPESLSTVRISFKTKPTLKIAEE